MIPADQIHPGALNHLREYLRTEIYRALSDRRPLEEKWIKYERMYRSQPEVQVKEFPFYGASNLVVPIVATDVDIIYSRIMGILFQPENLWTMKALRPDMIEYAPRVQEFMQWAQKHELNAYNAVADFTLDLTKLGTGILKQRYRREQKQVFNFREVNGRMQEEVSTLIKNHPILEHVSLWDFLLPADAVGIQEAAWASERIQLSWAQLMNRSRAGVYANVDQLGSWNATYKGSEIDLARSRMDNFAPGLGSKFEIWETWLDYDIRGDGNPVPIVVTMHMQTGIILRVDYNPFFHQEKPFSAARFQRQSKRFYGIGVAEMHEMTVEEITAMHNQRIDTGTIANSLMMKAKAGSGIKQDEPIFPGRWFILDDLNDIEPISWGTAHLNSTIQDEQLTRSYGVNRVGVNDYMMGASTPAIGYGGVGTNAMQHQEAAKRFDMTMREIRGALSESGTRSLELYQQFDQGGKIFQAMGEKDGQAVLDVLGFPLELIRFGIGVDVTATSASLNKEVEIRTNMIIMQMLNETYAQLSQGMQVVLNPGLPQELRAMFYQMMHGQVTVARRILDSHGEQDVDHLLPKLTEIMNGGSDQTGQQTQQSLGGQTAFAGGNAGAAYAPGQSGMGLAPAGMGSAGPAGLLTAAR